MSLSAKKKKHNIYYRKISFATPDCFAPYLVNVPTKEYYSICLEMGFIFKAFCVKILERGRIYVRAPFQKLYFRAVLAY